MTKKFCINQLDGQDRVRGAAYLCWEKTKETGQKDKRQTQLDTPKDVKSKY